VILICCCGCLLRFVYVVVVCCIAFGLRLLVALPFVYVTTLRCWFTFPFTVVVCSRYVGWFFWLLVVVTVTARSAFVPLLLRLLLRLVVRLIVRLVVVVVDLLLLLFVVVYVECMTSDLLALHLVIGRDDLHSRHCYGTLRCCC